MELPFYNDPDGVTYDGCTDVCKGRTIRKVMGGGGVGNFWLARIFFLAYCLCKNFFFDCSAVHEFFF